MTWVKLDDAMPENGKVSPLSDAAFRAYVTSICFASRTLTDGYVSVRQGKEYAGRPRVVQELTPHIWHVLPNLCDECRALLASKKVTVTDTGFYIHDYLKYNPTKAQVLADRAAAKARMDVLRSPERSPEQEAEPRPEVQGEVRPSPGSRYPDPDPRIPVIPLPLDPPVAPLSADKPPRPRKRELTEEDLVSFRDEHPNRDIDRQAQRYLTNEKAKAPGKRHHDQVAGFRNWIDREFDPPPTRHDPGPTKPASKPSLRYQVTA